MTVSEAYTFTKISQVIKKLCKGFIFLVLHGVSQKNLCNVQRGMPTAKATAAAKGTAKAMANAKAMAMADRTSVFKHRVVYVKYSSVYFLHTLAPCYIVLVYSLCYIYGTIQPGMTFFCPECHRSAQLLFNFKHV